MLNKDLTGIVRTATDVVSDTLDAVANTVTVRLEAASMKRVDQLVEAELFPDRATATMFLVVEGIKANAGRLGEIRAGLEETCSAKGQPPSAGGEAGFNLAVHGHAIEALKEAVARHETLRQSTIRASERLFEQRRRAAHDVIERVEQYVNRLANSPKEFDKTVAEYRVEAGRFDRNVERLEIEAARSTTVGSATGAVGAAAGVAVAALGPSAALAVAAAFGTASTGAAISALSGAAATSAALAWLGGGALAAGGGGMAAGSALVALAGPVGWTVAGVAVVGAAAYLHVRNMQAAEEATTQRVEVEAEIRALEAATREIEGLAERTEEHANGCLADLEWLSECAPADYRAFDDRQKERLAALVNHIRSLGELLGAQIAYGSG